MSHVCAVNPTDGTTAMHQVIQCADNLPIVKALLEVDQMVVNMQDHQGVSPMHLACKLGRKRIIEHLTVSFIKFFSAIQQ